VLSTQGLYVCREDFEHEYEYENEYWYRAANIKNKLARSHCRAVQCAPPPG